MVYKLLYNLNMFKVFFLMILSYFLGAIPTGYLIGKLKGIDIRQYGSGNPGTANVYRTLGKGPGIITFIVDFFKGFAPAFIAMHFFYIEGAIEFSKGHWWIPITAGALAIVGHIWTVFLNFKGGKGVATSAGVFMAILPMPTFGAFISFAIAVWISGHISVGSMTASIILPILCFIYDASLPFRIMAISVCALIFYTHIPNIKRIMAGKELSYKYNKKN